MEKLDLTGKVYGELTVIGPAPNRKVGGATRVFWKCKCSCGREKEVSASALRSGGTKSCGECVRHKRRKLRKDAEDLAGRKFGFLTVIERAEPVFRKNGDKITSRWRCKCDCGNEVVVEKSELTQGKTISCGCYRRSLQKEIGMAQRLQNRYDLSGDYGIGYTSNTNKPFYFDLEDYDKIKNYYWCEKKGYIVAGKRESEKGRGKYIFFHRLVMGALEYNGNNLIDHINHNPVDNRKENLRICSQKENLMNRKIKGCFLDNRRNKWVSFIKTPDGKTITKSFDTEEQAMSQRKMWEKEFFGEFTYKEEVVNESEKV